MLKTFPLLAALWLTGCSAATPAAQNGMLLAAAPADQPGENTGGGAIAGAIILGGAGGAVGSGVGKALAVAAGVIVGASAGSAVEAANQRHDGVAYTIRFTDGQVLTLIQHLNSGDTALAPGSAVTVETVGEEQQVLPRQF